MLPGPAVPWEDPPGKAWQPWPVPLPQPGVSSTGGTGAAPAMGIGQIPGDRDRLKPGQDVGPWLGPAWQHRWLGRAGPGGAVDGPCCSITEAGADIGSWAVGRWGEPQGPGRDTGACWCPQGPEIGTLKKMSLFELYSHLAKALETSRQCFSSNIFDPWSSGHLIFFSNSAVQFIKSV